MNRKASRKANNMTECDCCGKPRSVASMTATNRDSNGDPDGGSMCFVCKVEWERNQAVYVRAAGRYMPLSVYASAD